MVKELKEKFLRGKTFPLLSKVDDIHAITGLLKDFLRNLKEPLLTFRLNRNFMEAAGESKLKLLSRHSSLLYGTGVLMLFHYLDRYDDILKRVLVESF